VGALELSDVLAAIGSRTRERGAAGSVSNGIVEQQESGNGDLWSTLCTSRKTIEAAEASRLREQFQHCPKSSRDRT
jgi:hypothetical protein